MSKLEMSKKWRVYLGTLILCQSEWPKEKSFLLMHSRHTRNLYDPKIQIIFEIAPKKALGRGQRHFMNKFYNWLFFITSNEIIWSKKIQISCMRKKVPFWQFFRKADMALFNPCMKIKKILGQMYLFEVVNNSPL